MSSKALEPSASRRCTNVSPRLEPSSATVPDGERPSWFQPAGGVSTELKFGKPNWFECVAREHRATREAVAVFDQTSFGKILVQGRDAVSFLERVCDVSTCQSDVPPIHRS